MAWVGVKRATSGAWQWLDGTNTCIETDKAECFSEQQWNDEGDCVFITTDTGNPLLQWGSCDLHKFYICENNCNVFLYYYFIMYDTN